MQSEAEKASKAMSVKEQELREEYRKARRNLQRAIKRRQAKGIKVPQAPKIPKKVTAKSIAMLKTKQAKLKPIKPKLTQEQKEFRKEVRNLRRRLQRWEERGAEVTGIEELKTRVMDLPDTIASKTLREFDVREHLQYKGLSGLEAKTLIQKEIKEERKRQKIEAHKKKEYDESLERVQAYFKEVDKKYRDTDEVWEGELVYADIMAMLEETGATSGGRYYINQLLEDKIAEYGRDALMEALSDLPPEATELVQKMLFYPPDEEAEDENASQKSEGNTYFFNRLAKFGEMITEAEARMSSRFDDTV